MMLSYALLASVLPAFAAATAAVAAGGTVHTVTVGGADPPATPGSTPIPRLSYQPESINANVGDTVQFVFLQENHTATQSSFDTPCVKLEGGQDSGFKPNPNGDPGVTWDMKVNTADPMWVYCAQTDGAHCGHGMVFSVNAATTGSETFVDFKQLAIQQNGTAAVAGGDALTQPGGIVGGGSATATNTVTMGTPAVVTGSGTAADGSTCQCSCLCEPGQLPQGAGIGGFGGFAGSLPSQPQSSW